MANNSFAKSFKDELSVYVDSLRKMKQTFDSYSNYYLNWNTYKKPIPLDSNKRFLIKTINNKRNNSIHEINNIALLNNFVHQEWFKIIDEDSPFYNENLFRLKVNRENESALILCNEHRLVASRPDLNFDEILDNIIYEHLDGALSWWNENKDEYESLKSYQKGIVASGGDGYSGIISKDLIELDKKCNNLFYNSLLTLIDDMKSRYLSYSDSKVEDLSMFNGRRVFYFDNTLKEICKDGSISFGSGLPFFKTNSPVGQFFSYKFKQKLEEILGDKFWNEFVHHPFYAMNSKSLSSSVRQNLSNKINVGVV